MKDVKPWHEDDAFWEMWRSSMFSDQWMANTPVETDGIISLMGIKPGAHVLDLCCGVGRHSLELTRRGFQVTGVDRTERYLNQASEQAEREELNVDFVREDMRIFCYPDTFDAAINVFTSFSYFEDPAEDRQVVFNVYRSLKSGGIFLLETPGKETLARIFREKDWSETDGTFVLEARWIMFKDDKRTKSKISHRLYAGTEMVALLTGCGFSRVDIYGNPDGNSYDHRAQWLIAVGHK